MDRDTVISRIRKLLALAENNTSVHESASAAAMAQKLMSQHNIQAAMLEVETGTSQAQPVVSEALNRTGRVSTWTGALASRIAKLNNCVVYKIKGVGLQIVGEVDDIAFVRILFNWLEGEITRLCKDACSARYMSRGEGRVFANNFKIGAMQTVANRLEDQKKAQDAEVAALPNGSYALARIEHKLARVESHVGPLNKAKPAKYRGNADGYMAGVVAGRSVSLSPQGNKRLRG